MRLCGAVPSKRIKLDVKRSNQTAILPYLFMNKYELKLHRKKDNKYKTAAFAIPFGSKVSTVDNNKCNSRHRNTCSSHNCSQLSDSDPAEINSSINKTQICPITKHEDVPVHADSRTRLPARYVKYFDVVSS